MASRTYLSGSRIYSVDMMIAYVNIFKPQLTQLTVEDFESELAVDAWGGSVADYSPNDVMREPEKYKRDYRKIVKANLRYPIIVCGTTVVDGLHRLAKAKMKNKKTIKAYMFTKKLLNKFLLSSKADWEKVDKYKTYDILQMFYKKFCQPTD